MSAQPPPYHEPGKKLSEEAKAWFYNEVRDGRNPFQVGAQLGVSRPTVRNLMEKASKAFIDGRKLTPKQTAQRIANGQEGELFAYPDPIQSPDALPNERSRHAWDDFGYFRQRYFNRRHIKWQVEMCLILVDWLDEARRGEERIYGILNTPPGGGKTTTVTHDFPAWLIARNRNLRVALGSRTTPQAEKYVRRLRNTLEKNALLNLEYGRFKPEKPDLWRRDQFVVDGVEGHEASMDYKLAVAGFDPQDKAVLRALEDPENEIHEILGALSSIFITGEKEATVACLSQEMGFLGGRFDVNIWDDLVDRSNSRSPDLRESLADWWDREAISRCEPGGILALVGTRYGKYDLYKRCRDMVHSAESDIDAEVQAHILPSMTEQEIAEIREDLMKELVDRYGERPDDLPSRAQERVYRYIKYPAHDDEACSNPGSMKPSDHWDCLLDPHRFRWRDLMRAKAASPKRYGLTYQQEDESEDENLVKAVWLTGGQDEKGILYPGCLNYGRSLLDIPEFLLERQDKVYSIATVDPSAVNFWSIQWWLYDSETDRDYLVNLKRTRMMSGQFLTWDIDTQEYRGILQEWQTASIMAGWPIRMWIVEQAGAQRYLFQHKYVYQWMERYGVHIKGHETSPGRRSDPEFGVGTLGERYRYGRVDLPYRERDMHTRAVVDEFKQELLDWPDGVTQDMVMGHWFLDFNRYSLPKELVVSKAAKKLEHPYSTSMPPRMLAGRTPQAPIQVQGQKRRSY